MHKHLSYLRENVIVGIQGTIYHSSVICSMKLNVSTVKKHPITVVKRRRKPRAIRPSGAASGSYDESHVAAKSSADYSNVMSSARERDKN